MTAEEKVAAVHALHTPGPTTEDVISRECMYGECEHEKEEECPLDNVTPCIECSLLASLIDGGEYFIPYPCATIKAMS